MEIKRFIPESLDEALDVLTNNSDVTFLAGGTDVMVSSYSGIGVDPVIKGSVMFISSLDELKGIKKNEDGSVEIGALSTSREIAESDLIHPLLREAASKMGAISLRNSATIGGNIGNASPKGDMPQPLILLDAELVLLSKGGERRVKVDDYILGSKKTCRRSDEIITKIIIPKVDLTHYYYKKIGMRRANAISKLSLSCGAKVLDGYVLDFRASSGAAGPKVMRSREAEKILINRTLVDLPKYKEEFLDAWNSVISPHAMPEYRRGATRRMLEYFIDKLSSGASEGYVR